MVFKAANPAAILRHLHLQPVAHDREHRRGRAAHPPGLPQRRAGAQPLGVDDIQEDPVPRGAAVH